MGHHGDVRAALASGLLTLALVGAACDGDDQARPPDTGAGDEEEPSDDPAELPEPRTEVAGAAWDGRIVVVGGLLPDGSASDRADAYDPATNEWSPLPDLPRPLHHTAAVAAGGRVWVVGGYTTVEGDAWVPVRMVFSLGDGEPDWRVEPEMRELRGALAAVVVDDRILAAGGVDGADVLATTETFRPGDAGWETGPPMLEAREHFALAEEGAAAYAIAGRRGGAENNLTSVEVLAPGADAWTEGLPVNRSRSGIGAATVDGRVCVAGGEEPEGTIAPLECTVEDGWEIVAELSIPRHGLVVVALRNQLHVIGGGPEPGLTVSGEHEVFVL